MAQVPAAELPRVLERLAAAHADGHDLRELQFECGAKPESEEAASVWHFWVDAWWPASKRATLTKWRSS